jgi:phosphoribosylglycinamide formyltransferase-1
VNSSDLPKLGVLVSGRGSNLRAISDAISRGDLGATIGLVLSNREEAAGLLFARDRGLPTEVISHKGHASRDAYDQLLVAALQARNVSLVCLAGFMRLLGPRFCSAFPDRVLNIHPSLLPAFPGVDAQRQAWEHGVKVTGATVHLVTPELDAGPIVAQEAIQVDEHDTAQSLAARILAVEHRLYPSAIQQILAGGWHISGRRVVFGDRPRQV